MHDLELIIENCQENLQVYLEHDSSYPPDWDQLPDEPEYENYIENCLSQVVVINGSPDVPIPGAWYISVKDGYQWNLSVGQRKLYEILLAMQKGSLYAITTMGQLAEAMELKVVWAAERRLSNLQTVGAISGLPE